ncbi:MAG TPA: ATP-binding protein [Phycisphaerae bacterium]|nr:ATP-binding protein [Phycisphaerae bacterium]HOM53775.1 ATP-binding protein [Phycisphaerae bacterium]HON68334.1 ATP-binding protein [Phycisphaerae bacterium]HPP29192.1 ATP-binding protein [Phycisphaerae bacterium]HPZ96962.1 ATP-binding protein [Phycisphaerae bacterium]
MRIAVASGKGGTGKTTVATNLAHVASLDDRTVAYVDCDVEEPNGHLFLKPEWLVSRPVTRLIPKVDEAKCTHCGLCSQICQYSAIVPLGVTVLVYAEMCHACGGCALVCPAGAITETTRQIGVLDMGWSGNVQFNRGLLNIGEAMSPPLIRQTKSAPPKVDLTIIDAPPGTSCPAIESIRGSDFVLMVTEPTPFGLNDLRIAVDMVRALRLRMGVVINRAGSGDGQTADYCRANRLEILAEIPDDRRIAEAYSRGELICTALPEYQTAFEALLTRILRSESRNPNATSTGGYRR